MSLLAGIGAVTAGVGSLLSAGGSMWSSSENRSAQRDANRQNAWLDSTKHQREVLDLRAAGLNPILSANSASSPPTMQAATAGNPLDGLDRFGQAVQIYNSAKVANAAETNAETNAWQIYDATQLGSAGFKAKLLGKGFEAGGDLHTVRTIRINKVTGETYDALSGKRIAIVGDYPLPGNVPVSSAKTVAPKPHFDLPDYEVRPKRKSSARRMSDAIGRRPYGMY